MANQIDRQITEDGYKNAIVKFTGVLDISDIIESPAISLQDFSGNDPSKTLVGFRVELVEWAISNGVEVLLSWNSMNPQQIFPLAGRGRINGSNYGGFVPDTGKIGYDGSINLITTGCIPGVTQTFTVVLELIKMYQ